MSTETPSLADSAPLSDAEADGLLASTILTDEGRQDPYTAYALAPRRRRTMVHRVR